MIYLYPMDSAGCGNYRIRWPALVLQERGLDVYLVNPGENAGVAATLSNDQTVKGVTAPDDCEAVVLQRPTSEVLVETIPYLKKKGVRVVVDVDDDLAAISARHPGWAHMHKQSRGMTGQSWDAVIEACEMADMVVASTPALLERYAKHGRGALVRNCLPDKFFDVELPEKDDKPHVGWAGSILSHPDDLSVIGPALAQLRCDVRVVGPVPIDLQTHEEDWKRARRLLGTDRVEFTGKVEFDQWIPAISQLHIGMAPLEMSRFNVAKSWLKPLEYSVAKVPFVCSGTPEYIEYGGGLVADKPQVWRKHLKRLLDSEELRAEEIERNYKLAEQYRISDHADLWREAWLGR